MIARLFRIEWHNPYTSPPDNAPRILAEYFEPESPSAARIPAALLDVPHTIGGGYGITISHPPPPPRQLSAQSLSRVRQKRAQRRIRAKVPLFADEFVAQELVRKPDYYAGITAPDIEARKQATLELERAERERLWARPNTLIVYGTEPAACRARAEQIRQEFRERQVHAQQHA